MRQLAITILPARLNSKRLPNKLLEKINGKTILARSYEQASKATQTFYTAIASDNTKEIYEESKRLTNAVWKTSNESYCGTSRAATVAAMGSLSKAELVVVVHANNINIDPGHIDNLILEIGANPHYDMITTVYNHGRGYTPTTLSSVRAVLDTEGKLVDLVRDGDLCDYIIPDGPYLEHVGITVFKKSALFKFLRLNPCKRARTQDNEYLTAVDAGFKIGILETKEPPMAINTQEDLDNARKLKERKDEDVKIESDFLKSFLGLE